METQKRQIMPSILAADFAHIAHGILLAEQVGAQELHLDVMDGNFVPPISFGASMVKAIRNRTTLSLDVHLMVVNPANHIDAFASAGADALTFHAEAEVHAHRLAVNIRERGMQSGVSIVPSTPVEAIGGILDVVDQVLVMTVNPGYGGQKLISSTLEKVRVLGALRRKGAGNYRIIVDGGFCLDTAAAVWDAGVDTAVMGSAFFDSDDPQGILNACRNISKIAK